MKNSDLWRWIILPWRIGKFLVMVIVKEFVLFLCRIPGWINCLVAHSKYHEININWCSKCERTLI